MTSPPRPPFPGTGLDLAGARGFWASWRLAGPTAPTPRHAAGWPCQSPALDSSRGGLRGWETVPYLSAPSALLVTGGRGRQSGPQLYLFSIYSLFI